MSNEQSRKEVWEGRIPVCFIPDSREMPMGGNVMPEPCFMMLPRISYFPFVYDKLEKLFARAVGASLEDKIWLSFGPTPLKWHYPVGVLYDLHARGFALPWEITVHFKKYPSDILLLYEGKEALEAHFKSKIKEADWLKHGAKVIQQLTPQDFGHLWQGFSQGSFNEFWSVNQKMMLNMRGDEEPFKQIPFCIYRVGQRLFQRLIPSEGTTYGDLIQMYYKDSDISANSVFLVHGVELPLDTPLQWLSEHLCYPDNFIHIVVTSKS